ncbi:hypothetical protein J6590_004041 [Homalodisca vitripennis]|nr:hypothetical protein J6590_004041 [Homalodisca vitripennis]
MLSILINVSNNMEDNIHDSAYVLHAITIMNTAIFEERTKEQSSSPASDMQQTANTFILQMSVVMFVSLLASLRAFSLPLTDYRQTSGFTDVMRERRARPRYKLDQLHLLSETDRRVRSPEDLFPLHFSKNTLS